MKSKVADFQERTAPEVEERDEAWFLTQLESKCPEVVVKGRFFEMLCPFHADSNIGSFGVNRQLGFYKCFSCGAKGPWNRLAEHLGMEKLAVRGGESASSSMQDVKDDMTRALRKAGVDDPNKRREKKNRPIVKPWPRNKGWRAVRGRVLSKLGCIQVVDLQHNTLRIGLPVRNLGGELLGYTCRALDPEDAEPKYTPLAADRTGWRKKELPATEALFLVERALEEDWEYAILVEGPYDALRLYALGVPALAILGTNSWTPQKAAILAGLGLKAIVVLMDNDDSGREAQDRIVDDLRRVTKCIGLNLPPKKKDPGVLSDKQVLWIQKKAEALCSGSTP